jgi:aminotransferase
MAGIVALEMGESFYTDMVAKYQALRDQLCEVAQKAGFQFRKPEGTYYLFTDASAFGFGNDRQLWEFLLHQCGLATVAGYCFYRPESVTQNIRFCYAKSPRTIEMGAQRLARFSEKVGSWRSV